MGTEAYGTLATNAAYLGVTGCTFIENSGPSGTCVNYYEADGEVLENTFYENSVGIASVRVDAPTKRIPVARNIFYGEQQGYGLVEYGGVDASCNLYYQNAKGDHYPALGLGEITADPLFCDPSQGNFAVSTDSPAAPSNNSCAEQIGAVGTGCEAPRPELIMSADTAGGMYGEEVATTVSLRLADANAPVVSSIGGLDFVLLWNPIIATFVRIESTDETANWQIASDDTHVSHGELHVSMAGLDGFDVGPEKVGALRVVFEFASDGGYTSLDLTQTKVFTTEPAPVSHRTEAGTLTEGCEKGDVYPDGEIDSADAILALKIAVELIQPTITQFCAADMNNDGEVNVADVVLILQAAVGSAKMESAKSSVLAASVELNPSSEGATLNLSGIAGLDAELTYDPSKIHFVAASSQNGLVIVNDEQEGLIHAAYAASSENDATIDLQFESLNGGGLLTLQQVWACDLEGQSAGLSSGEQSVFVSSAATSTPSSSRKAQLLGIYPNPFNPQTVIKFRLDAHRSDLSIFDAAGHHVRSFDLSNLGVGEHSIRWSGRDDAGHTVSSGVYYLRLLTSQGSEVLRAVLLK